jgi:hypothetical protein
MSVKLVKAGVAPERIAPGKPQQNGRLERFHLTLLQDTASPPATSARAQARRFAAYQRLYNEERPHQALANRTPAELYDISPRRFDGVLREPAYGPDHQVRRVRSNGEIKWGGEQIYINEALAGEPVGLIEDENGAWWATYGPIDLGFIDHRGDRLKRPKSKARGRVDNPPGLPTSPPAQPQPTT